MQTIFDWVSLAIFAGLAVLFLQRSVEPEARDRMIEYLPPAVGCALGNYLGNRHHEAFAVLVLAATVAYIFHFLKPFQRP